MTQLALPLARPSWVRGGENPYWTACRLVLGREPRAVDLLLWMSWQWRTVASAHGLRDASGLMLRLGVAGAEAAMMSHLDALVSRAGISAPHAPTASDTEPPVANSDGS